MFFFLNELQCKNDVRAEYKHLYIIKSVNLNNSIAKSEFYIDFWIQFIFSYPQFYFWMISLLTDIIVHFVISCNIELYT